MKRTKFIPLLLALCMLVALLSGCGTASVSSAKSEPAQSASEPADSTPEAEPSVEPDAEPTDGQEAQLYPLCEETTTLTCMNNIYMPATGYMINGYEDVEIYNVAEETTNVHIEFETANTDAYGQLVNITIASGEYPDIVQKWMQFSGSSADQMVEDEVLVDLAPLLDEYFPNLTKAFEEYPTALNDMITDNGVLAATYSLSMQNNTSTASGLVIRQDYLAGVGMSEVPETYDAMEEALTAIKTEYGLEYPFQLSGYGLSDGFSLGFNSFFSVTSPAGGIELRAFYQEDGVVKCAWTDSTLVDYLTMINRWYREGLVNADWIVMSDIASDPAATEKRITGETAMWGARLGEVDAQIENGKQTNSDFALSPVAVLAVEKGQDFNFSSNRKCAYSSEAYGVTTQCEQLEIACRWLDYWYGDEGVMLANYGILDKTYTLDAEGNVSFTDFVIHPEGEYVPRNVLSSWTNVAMPTLVDDIRDALLVSAETAKFIDTWEINKSTKNLMPAALSLTSEESERASTIYSDIETCVLENLSLFMTGARPLSEIEAFQEQIAGMQLDEIIDIMQGALERYNSRS